MNETSKVLPFTVISTDVVRSSAGGYLRHESLSNAANRALVEASRHSPVSKRWRLRDNGDGDLALVPPEVPKSWLAAGFPWHLRAELDQFNRDKAAQHQVRLRLAMDFGDVRLSKNERAGSVAWRAAGGEPLVNVARLRESRVVKDLMKQRIDMPMVIVLSDRFYHEAVVPGDYGVQSAVFQKVTAETDDGYSVPAWLHVPGNPGALSTPVPGPAGDNPLTRQNIATGDTGTGESPAGGSPSTGTVMSGVFAREITGGTQIGTNNGDIHLARQESAQGGSGLAAIRRVLSMERQAGHVDDETALAAEQELAAAEGGWHRGDHRAARLAVRRFKGLADESESLTGLAAAWLRSHGRSDA